MIRLNPFLQTYEIKNIVHNLAIFIEFWSLICVWFSIKNILNSHYYLILSAPIVIKWFSQI